MSLSPRKKGLFALLVCLEIAAGCQPPNSGISSAEGDKGRPNNSSGGLGNLTPGGPDGGAKQMDPPTNIKPWPDAGAYPDTAPTGKNEMCAAESQAAKQV